MLLNQTLDKCVIAKKLYNCYNIIKYVNKQRKGEINVGKGNITYTYSVTGDYSGNGGKALLFSVGY